MKFLHLIRANLFRRKARSAFTLLSIVVAFVLFALLSAIRLAFSMGVDITGEDRLIMIHKVSLIQPLPYSYQARLETMPGVRAVSNSTWFGGIYQRPQNFFPQMPVEPERFLDMYPEFLLSDEQRRTWLAERTGAIVGRKTAERFGWKVGDRIPIHSPIWRRADGQTHWEFTISGIYDGAEKGVDDTQFFFHYDYFDEARGWGKGLVGWYVVRIDDPARAVEIAKNLDGAFANSRYETKTTTEKAFVQSFANQVGNVGAILTAVIAAVFFTILLVAGNTMAQSVRERTSELAVLKTLGFSSGLVLALVLAEALALALTGGVFGLGLGWILASAMESLTVRFLPVFYVPARALAFGLACAVALGLAAGSLPALRAMRLRIVDALRRA